MTMEKQASQMKLRAMMHHRLAFIEATARMAREQLINADESAERSLAAPALVMQGEGPSPRQILQDAAKHALAAHRDSVAQLFYGANKLKETTDQANEAGGIVV